MDPISSIGAKAIASPFGAGAAGGLKGASGDFGSAFKKALDQVSNQQNQADDLAKRFQLNDPEVSLEQTMLAAQTANISFQALVQVRNRVVAAYQDVMNMQV